MYVCVVCVVCVYVFACVSVHAILCFNFVNVSFVCTCSSDVRKFWGSG